MRMRSEVGPAAERSGAAPWQRRVEVGGGVGLRPTGAALLRPVSRRLGGPCGPVRTAISISNPSGGRCGLLPCALRSRAQKPAALPQGPGAWERRGEAWAGGEPREAGSGWQLRRSAPCLPAGKKEDAFNVLDLAEYTKSRPWWKKVFAPSSGSSAEKYNVATQLVIGGVTGW